MRGMWASVWPRRRHLRHSSVPIELRCHARRTLRMHAARYTAPPLTELRRLSVAVTDRRSFCSLLECCVESSTPVRSRGARVRARVSRSRNGPGEHGEPHVCAPVHVIPNTNTDGVPRIGVSVRRTISNGSDYMRFLGGAVVGAGGLKTLLMIVQRRRRRTGGGSIRARDRVSG